MKAAWSTAIQVHDFGIFGMHVIRVRQIDVRVRGLGGHPLLDGTALFGNAVERLAQVLVNESLSDLSALEVGRAIPGIVGEVIFDVLVDIRSQHTVVAERVEDEFYMRRT